VPRTLLISTDKACQPVNIYGMSKAMGERLFAECNRWREQMLFGSVRYGNVIGSTGSIVPVFRDQLLKHSKITITDRRMTRFWMSPDQAVDAVLLALGEMSKYPGAVFVPRASAMRVIDLARVVAGEAPVEEIGLRPGEKIHETLIHYQEATKTLDRGDYFVVQPATSRDEGQPWTYASHSPSRWIEPLEMAEMIEVARGI
jgi:UDP-N-acetylglucosamine 4,6-dehydratase